MPTSSSFPLLVGSGWLLTIPWLAWRYRWSDPVERLQLKWFASAGIVSVVALIILLAVGLSGWNDPGLWWPIALYALAMTLVPVAVGVAILRYDLYAIDRIINRAIVYSALTALLAVAFAVTITALGTIARITLIGSGEGDAVIVALSTLTIAALFNPLRRLIQTAVDRRFDRARYDTTRTIDAFAERLRGTLDLEQLETEMLEVVRGALRPSIAGVWLGRGR